MSWTDFPNPYPWDDPQEQAEQAAHDAGNHWPPEPERCRFCEAEEQEAEYQRAEDEAESRAAEQRETQARRRQEIAEQLQEIDPTCVLCEFGERHEH